MRKIILLTLMVVSVCTSVSGKKKMNTKEIGLQLYSVRQDITNNFEKSLDSVAAAGYSFVEAANYKDGLFYGLKPEAYKEALKRRNLKFLSSHANKVISELSSFEKDLEWWDQAIAAHKAAGVKYLVMPSMNMQFALKSIENLKHYCDYMNAIGEKCKKAGIRFGFHNHDGEFKRVDNVVAYDFMLANTNPDFVFFQLDLYWANKAKVDILAYFEKYPGRFELLHLKDDKELGASGKIDFKKILTYSKIAGVRYLIVEQEDFSFSRFVSVKKSLEFLQNILK
jgi:sugar phosphate isomerase/epimerase